MNRISRRRFLQLAGTTCIGSVAGISLVTWKGCQQAGDEVRQGKIVTVTGSIDPGELKVTLPHEHVLVDFIGADQVSRDRYDRSDAFEKILPHLMQIHNLGCDSFVECTPAYLGRNPLLLLELAKASGLKILTNTGYYGAANDKYIPDHAYTENADELASRWIQEWESGIEETGVFPGFIKIGVDAGPLSDIDGELVVAAARTHLNTGLTIACHTGDGEAAFQEIQILQNEGLDGSALIWVHAQNAQDSGLHVQAAEKGVWVEFDGIGPSNVADYIQRVLHMKEAGLLGRVLLSHDAGWYRVGEPGGGKYRPHDTLFTEFIPALKAAGFSGREIRQMTVDNPREAFIVRIRRL